MPPSATARMIPSPTCPRCPLSSPYGSWRTFFEDMVGHYRGTPVISLIRPSVFPFPAHFYLQHGRSAFSFSVAFTSVSPLSLSHEISWSLGFFNDLTLHAPLFPGSARTRRIGPSPLRRVPEECFFTKKLEKLVLWLCSPFSSWLVSSFSPFGGGGGGGVVGGFFVGGVLGVGVLLFVGLYLYFGVFLSPRPGDMSIFVFVALKRGAANAFFRCFRFFFSFFRRPLPFIFFFVVLWDPAFPLFGDLAGSFIISSAGVLGPYSLSLFLSFSIVFFSWLLFIFPPPLDHFPFSPLFSRRVSPLPLVHLFGLGLLPSFLRDGPSPLFFPYTNAFFFLVR